MDIDQLEISEGFEKKYYTGYMPLRIVAVCPTAAELQELFNSKKEFKEPKYVGEEGKSTRIDFYVRNHEKYCDKRFLDKLSIFVENTPKVGKKRDEAHVPNRQYIDAYSKTTWAVNLADLSQKEAQRDPLYRLDQSTVRECMVGEEKVYELMKIYANVRPSKNQFKLDSFEKIVKGDFSELQRFFKKFEQDDDKGIKALLTIREGKYQSIYTEDILGLRGTVTDKVLQNLKGQFGCKDYYQDQVVLQEYVPDDSPFHEDQPNGGAASSTGSGATTGAKKPLF